MPIANHLKAAALAVSLGSLAACAQVADVAPTSSAQSADGTPKAESQPAFTRFPDIPVPTAAAMDVERTLIFGGEKAWYGRLAMTTDHNANAVFDFYKQELPGFGWQEVTSVRAENSILTYSQGDRIATIQIRSTTIRGSALDITVSPGGNGKVPSMGALK